MQLRIKEKVEVQEVVISPAIINEMSLQQQSDGSVSVKIGPWYILQFLSNGTFRRTGSVPTDLGFELDSMDKIVEQKE